MSWAHSRVSTGVGGWFLVSTPLDPLAPPSSVESVYDELPGVALYVWDIPTSSYVAVTGADLVESRWGYWLYLTGDTTITVEGTDTSADITLNFPNAGWYMISAPYNFAWDKASGTDIETDLAGNMRIVSYNPETGKYSNHFQGDGFVGSAWYGYWVRATAAGATLTLKKADPALPPSPIWVTTSVPSSQLKPENLEMPPAPPSFVPEYANPQIKVALSVDSTAVTFRVEPEVEALRVEVFDLGGGLVYQARADGSELTWAMVTSAGQPVANGVYLAKVVVKTEAGWVPGGLFRVLVLR